MTQATLVMFAVFVGITTAMTYMASAKSTSTRGFFTADKQIGGLQNGWAIAGDYMSGAAFLGVIGLVAFFGFDGLIFALGWVVAFVVLLLVAEPLRNAGHYTVADVLAFRLGGRGVRAIAALTALSVTLFYMVAQIVGAGSIINMLVVHVNATLAVTIASALMVVYVLFGGILATTRVLVFKAILLIGSSVALTALVLLHFHFSFATLFAQAGTRHLLAPGLYFSGKWGALDEISLALGLALGAAGLPHIVTRFFNVRTAKAARVSVSWALALVIAFFFLATFIGLGAGTIVGPELIGKHVADTQAIRYIAHAPGYEQATLNADLRAQGYIVPRSDSNLAAPLLAHALAGPLLQAFIAAVAFSTILAVVVGLTITASGAFAHDLWYVVVRHRRSSEHERMLVARITSLVVALVAIYIGIKLRGFNVAFLLGLAFSVGASANVPSVVLALTWRRFTRGAAVASMATGLISSLVLIAISPDVLHEHAIFPLRNPGIVTIPLSFFVAIVTSLVRRDLDSERRFAQLSVQAATPIGADGIVH